MSGKYMETILRLSKMRALDEKTAGVLLATHVEQQDGGPGSGNWGHSGRPGKVGGSGKGGGAHYRGGRSDIGYYGSKKDWLNGLSGEKQYKAVRLIAEAKRGMQGEKDAINNMVKRGLLTYEEGRKRIAETEKEQEGMTPEQYIMSSNKMKPFKREFVDTLAEARSWPKTAKPLIEGNLTPEEQKVVEHLANIYNAKEVSGMKVPDDTVDFDDWEDRDRDVWLDLKAKACGGPTSGKPIPEKMLIESGAKKGPNKGVPDFALKMDDTALYEQVNHLRMASSMYNDKIDLTTGEGVQEAETKAFKMAYGNYQKDRAVKLYVRDGLDALGGTQFFLSDECKKRLPEDEWVEVAYEMQAADGSGQDFFDRIDNMDQWRRLKYLAIINKGMGGTDNVAAVMERRKKEIDQREEENRRILERLKQEQEKIRKEREERARKEAEEKAKRAPVIEAAKNALKNDGILPKINAAKTTKDVSDVLGVPGMFAKDAKPSLDGIPVGIAKSVGAEYSKMFQAFPFMVGEIEPPTIFSIGGDAYADCGLGSGKVRLEQQYYGANDESKLKASYERDVASGYHPVGTDYKSIVTHELTHAIEGSLVKQLRAKGKCYAYEGKSSISAELREKTFTALGLGRYTKEKAKKYVCRYAAKNSTEWLAECIAEAYYSSNPRPMAVECRRQLEKFISDNGLEGGLNG